MGSESVVQVAVVGLGKLGLPLAVQFAYAGAQVCGVDKDSRHVRNLTINDLSGLSPEHLLEERFLAVREAGALDLTTSTGSAVRDAEVVVIVVPVINAPGGCVDFSYLKRALEDVGHSLSRGTVVAIETTLPVGATRKVAMPTLERASGMNAGRDFHLVYSPERVTTGRTFADLKRYPKLVAGFTEACRQRGMDFYSNYLDFEERPDLDRPNGVWGQSSLESAELAKLAETSYRDLNIAFANQLSQVAMELNVDLGEVIEACNSQPFSHIHSPGISVGGHCIPVYPQLLLSTFPNLDLVRAARKVNSAGTSRVISDLVSRNLQIEDARVLILGVTYRPGVRETFNSGALELRKALVEMGAMVFVHDSTYSSTELESMGLSSIDDKDQVDILILHTAHPEYLDLDISRFPGLKCVWDGRGVLDPARWRGVPHFVSILGRSSSLT